jgi:non-canonical purine NTP pyrophosphatase (RdgB/HAM1 family)
MAKAPIRIVVGTGNAHKFEEIRAILSDVSGIELVPLSTFTGVPPIIEDEPTFEGNAKKKALELARFLALAQRVQFANQSTAADDDEDDETDFEALSAKRAKETSGRMPRVKLGSSGRLSPVPLDGDLENLVIADDSGLEVDALKGAPGVLSARYAGKHGDDAANNALLLKNLKGVPNEKRKARFVCTIALASPAKALICTRGTVEGRIALHAAGNGGFGYDPLFYYPPLGKTFGEIDAGAKNKLSHRSQALARFKVELQKLLGS